MKDYGYYDSDPRLISSKEAMLRDLERLEEENIRLKSELEKVEKMFLYKNYGELYRYYLSKKTIEDWKKSLLKAQIQASMGGRMDIPEQRKEQ